MADPTVYDDSPIWDMDRRTAAFKRLVNAVDEIHSDLGGRDKLSFNQRMLAEQLALQREWLNIQWQNWMQGKKVDIETIIKVSNSLRQTASLLGMERKARDVPSLNSIIDGESQ